MFVTDAVFHCAFILRTYKEAGYIYKDISNLIQYSSKAQQRSSHACLCFVRGSFSLLMTERIRRGVRRRSTDSLRSSDIVCLLETDGRRLDS